VVIVAGGVSMPDGQISLITWPGRWCHFTRSYVSDLTGQALFSQTDQQRAAVGGSACRVHYVRQESDDQHYDRSFVGLCGRHLNVLTTRCAIYHPLMCGNQIQSVQLMGSGDLMLVHWHLPRVSHSLCQPCWVVRFAGWIWKSSGWYRASVTRSRW